MPDETYEPLSEEELAELNARYSPFPSFGDWPKALPDSDLWQRSRDQFQEVADETTDEELARVQDFARRAAAFDTGAIEGLYATNRGLTFTVAEQAAAWEQKVEAQGSDARTLFEAQLHAFELVLDHVTDRFPRLTQAWLRRLHEEITAPQETYVVHTPIGPQEQPLPKGEYKRFPNHVRTADGQIHAYAPVDATQSEMQRLIEEVEDAEFQAAHPVIQASYVHYGLVVVHPFADGNGRLARAVASAYTYRDARIPLMILNEHRHEYFAVLAKADAGDPVPFVGFIARVTRETLDLLRDDLQTVKAPQPTQLLDEFTNMYGAQELREQHDLAAQGFVDWLVAAAEKQIAGLEAPSGVQLEVQTFDKTRNSPPSGFRNLDRKGTQSFRVTFESAPPASARLPRRIDVFISAEQGEEGNVLLKGVQVPDEQLVLRRSELEPHLSSLAQHKAENFLRRLLGEGLNALLKEAQSQLGM